MSDEYLVKHMGEHRGNARLWFETRRLDTVGLSKGTRYRLSFDPDKVELIFRPDRSGDRVVSGKMRGAVAIPIIDINSSAALGPLAEQPAVKAVFDEKGKRLVVSMLSHSEFAQASREGKIRRSA